MVGLLVYITISAALYAIFALGLNLQWGVAGLINFGHVAFMIVGGYATVLLTAKGIPIIIAVGIGAAIAAGLGLLIGLSTLRLREDYLAIVTIGVSELLRLIAENEEDLTQGSFGVQRFPLPLAQLQPNSFTIGLLMVVLTAVAVFAVWQLWRATKQQWRQYQQLKGKSYQPRRPIAIVIWGIVALALILTVYINGLAALSVYNYKAGLMVLVLVALALVYWGLEVLVHSPWGRVLKAIREDEDIARALGKNVFSYKLQAFMIGGMIAAIAGAFYAWQLTTVYPRNFEPIITFNAWTIMMLGGAGRNAGVLLGAVIFFAYDASTRFVLPSLGLVDSTQLGAFRLMVIGLILMLIMVWRPQGLLGNKEELTLNK